MTRRHSRKFKPCVRFKTDIWGHGINKNIRALKKSTPSNNSNTSEYGIRLLAKQKLKHYYCNINEKQFKNIYKRSLKYPGKSYENLLILLERRLDTVVYRMNFASTFFSSRQLISHGHIKVNGKSVDIPSYTLKNGDVVSIKDKSKDFIYKLIIENFNKDNKFLKPVPTYVEVNYKTLAGILFTTPVMNEIPYKINMEVKKALEFYKG